jgi:hypothetical protein
MLLRILPFKAPVAAVWHAGHSGVLYFMGKGKEKPAADPPLSSDMSMTRRGHAVSAEYRQLL